MKTCGKLRVKVCALFVCALNSYNMSVLHSSPFNPEDGTWSDHRIEWLGGLGARVYVVANRKPVSLWDVNCGLLVYRHPHRWLRHPSWFGFVPYFEFLKVNKTKHFVSRKWWGSFVCKDKCVKTNIVSTVPLFALKAVAAQVEVAVHLCKRAVSCPEMFDPLELIHKQISERHL
jgi:hypothetical protein